MTLRSLALVLAVLAWAGCGDDDPTGLVTGLRIEGSVSELGTGTPIANAPVLLGFPQGNGLGSRTAFTNANGRYVITFSSQVPFSDCRGFFLTVDPDGYQAVTEDEIRCVSEQTIDFELRPSG